LVVVRGGVTATAGASKSGCVATSAWIAARSALVTGTSGSPAIASLSDESELSVLELQATDAAVATMIAIRKFLDVVVFDVFIGAPLCSGRSMREAIRDHRRKRAVRRSFTAPTR
jgi:hypothetical protein